MSKDITMPGRYHLGMQIRADNKCDNRILPAL